MTTTQDLATRANALQDHKPNALASLIDGSRTGKREQAVLTPQPIVDALCSIWTRIGCDVSGPPGESLLDAEHVIRPPQDGLAFVWGDRSYCNPEYKDLAPWLLHEHIAPRARVGWLVPVRPHRKWWRQWARERVDEIIYLNPIAFVGHEQAFPAPLCLGYRGEDAAKVAPAFAHLGSPIDRPWDLERVLAALGAELHAHALARFLAHGFSQAAASMHASNLYPAEAAW